MNLKEIGTGSINIDDYLKTGEEISRAKRLINDSNGLVDLVSFDGNSPGEMFGPRGYRNEEHWAVFYAILEKLPESDSIVVVSPGRECCVTIFNRKKRE